MLIPAKQTLGFAAMGYHQNALLLNTSQGLVISFYGMKPVTLMYGTFASMATTDNGVRRV